MVKKRGQTIPIVPNASQAATLLIFIAILIMIYLFMIPPNYRNEILGINTTNTTTDDDDGTTIENLLLDESPGSLYPTEQQDFSHPLNQVVLSSVIQEMVLAEKQSIYVERSKVSKKEETMFFSINNIDGTPQTMLLTFSVENAKGRLIIDFNGKEIFNRELNEGTVNPITIPVQNIQLNNELRFYTSDVGLAFWATNRYELSDAKLLATVKNTDAQTATTSFIISQQEIENFDTAYLRYISECSGDVGVMKIYLNDNMLTSKAPTCMAREKLDLTKSDLVSGTNELRFELSRGSVYLTNLGINLQIKEPRWPAYYFEINQTIYDKIQNDDYDTMLRIKFIETSDDKEAEININGRKFMMEEDTNFYEKNIQGYLIKGNNYIKLIPKTDLEIATLRIAIV